MNIINKRILIDTSIDYEITFFVKSTDNSPITFGVIGYNQIGNQVNLKDIVSLNNNNIFFGRVQLPVFNKYYFIRGILYNFNASQLNSEDGLMKCGFGNDLKLDIDIKYIVPYIILDNNTGGNSGDLYLYDIKIRPLKFDFELGIIGVKNLIVTWMKNNNLKYSNDSISRIMKEKLLPYNCMLLNKFI
jgi:hypothetical protein